MFRKQDCMAYTYASEEELVVLVNLEDTNADLIRQKVHKIERLKILREKAYRQLKLLKKNQDTIETLKKILLKIQKQIVDFLSKVAYNLYRNILLLSTVT